MIINIGWNFIENRQREQNTITAEQNLLTTELNVAGAELDELQTSLSSSGIVGEVTREKYCYHASRKFEVGPLYCVQRLDIEAEKSTD